MKPPVILDPQAVPVLGTDAHLPAVDAGRLSAPALRARFSGSAAWTPELEGDAGASPLAPVAASVLMPLVMREDGPHLLLTVRTAHLRDHAGQISLPGGRAEPTDADAVDTALRETEEEIGLSRSRVEVIGSLPPYGTVTNYRVTPVVALVQPPFELALDAFEVADAFEVPLAFLLDPAHHQRHRFVADGQSRDFLSMPWRGPGADGVMRVRFIWGATAAMLRNLYRFLAA